MKTVLFLFVLMFHNLFAQESATLKELFDKYGVQGTMIIQSFDGQKKYVYNEQRANQPLLPASTFKIPNTLIALDMNLIENENAIIVWDKQEREITQWNQDQTLKSAFQNSCVWCYQYFALQLSIEQYKNYLKILHYGNEEIGESVTSFWLDGQLRITPYQQIAFLKKLHNNELPFKIEHLEILKSIMIEKENENYTIRAKTGWAKSEVPNHGWYLGDVQTKEDVWFFATNIITKSAQDLPKRKYITMQALKNLDIVPKD
jgi:beta-lactamase class D